MSVNDTPPNTLFGGEWEKIEDMFLLGAGTTYASGETGGEARHMLTVDEMPSHSHAIKSDINNPSYNQEWPAWTEYTTGWTQSAVSSETAPTFTQTAGGNTAHNNMPPYLAVNIWKRTK